MSKIDLVVLGFPKCGTSALMRAFERDERFNLGRSVSGALEVNILNEPEALREEGFLRADKINVHKNVAYAFNRKNFEELNALNPNVKFIVCIRDPLKALVSWHKMHQKIAIDGNNKNHFAYKERDFYSTCSLEEYYERFAKPKLRYHFFMQSLFESFPKGKTLAIEQSALANNINECIEHIVDFLHNDEAQIKFVSSPSSSVSHQGYADKVTPVLACSIVEELNNTADSINALLKESEGNVGVLYGKACE